MNKSLSIAFAFVVATATSLSFSQETKGDAKAGESKIAMCIGCHGIPGYQASFPEVYKVPKISGQGEKYISNALNAYKKGERRHPTMKGIAYSLSDQDIADISAYYANHGKVEGAALPEKASDAKPQVAALLAKGACTSCHGENFAKPIDPSYPDERIRYILEDTESKIVIANGIYKQRLDNITKTPVIAIDDLTFWKQIFS